MSLRSLGRRVATVGAVASAIAVLGVSAASATPLPKLTTHTPAGASATGQRSAMATDPPSIGSRMNAGATLDMAHSLQSPSGQHLIVVNSYLGAAFGLVLTGYTGDPIVLSQTGSSSAVTNKLTMQSDGNLVLYTTANGVTKATFQTRTSGKPGAYAVLQDDRNLVVYSSAGKPLWASNTAMTNASSYYLDAGNNEGGYLDPGWYLQSANRKYKLTMQTDGNLVLYSSNKAIWTSATNGNRNAEAVLQSDGNFVVYSAAGKALWNTRTSRNVVGANVLTLQNDGNLVMYFYADKVTQVRWQTKTAGR